MKKKINRTTITLFSLILLLGLSVTMCKPKAEKPEAKTTVGMFTPYAYFPETLHGMVNTLTETNYWAVDENGTIKAGDRISIAARDTFKWTNDFKISFMENGMLDKCDFLDENDLVTGYWEAESYGNQYAIGKWYKEDTLRTVSYLSYADSLLAGIENRSAGDTLLYKATIENNSLGKPASLQWSDYAGKEGARFDFAYNPDGSLEHYTLSRDDTIRWSMNFIYNDKGFTQSQEVYDPLNDTRNIYTYDYTYDEKGNWISYVGYEDGVPRVFCQRVYTYYPE